MKSVKTVEFFLYPVDPVVRGFIVIYSEGEPADARFSQSHAKEAMRGLCIALVLGKIRELLAVGGGVQKGKLKQFTLCRFDKSKSSWGKSLAEFFMSDSQAGWSGDYLRGMRDAGNLIYYDNDEIVATAAWSRFDIHLHVAKEVGLKSKENELTKISELEAFASDLGRFGKWEAEVDDQIEDLRKRVDAEIDISGARPESLPRERTSLLELELGAGANAYPTFQGVANPGDLLIADPKTQFRSQIIKYGVELESGLWMQLLKKRQPPDPRAMLTAQIGRLHRLKTNNLELRCVRPVPNDPEYLLEATWQVFRVAGEAFQEFEKLSTCIGAALSLLDNDKEYGARNPDLRNSWVDGIRNVLGEHRIYVFLLYFTSLVITKPKDKWVNGMSRLLKRNIFFRLLEDYPPGIHYQFVRFHGIDLFSRTEQFKNQYWQRDPLRKDDCLETVFQRNYRVFHVDERACYKSLKAHNKLPVDFDTSRLLSKAKATRHLREIVIAPPHKQTTDFQQAMDRLDEWFKTPDGLNWLQRIRYYNLNPPF